MYCINLNTRLHYFSDEIASGSQLYCAPLREDNDQEELRMSWELHEPELGYTDMTILKDPSFAGGIN